VVQEIADQWTSTETDISKLDWKKGKFNSDFETAKTFSGLEGWRTVYGDILLYYRFDPVNSVTDPIYDEAGVTGGRAYLAPIAVPVLHVTHIQGENEYGQYGLYYNDTLDATISFAAFTGAGLRMVDIEEGTYLNDRVVYNHKVFRVYQLQSRGKIQERSLIIALHGTQLKPDELVDDPQFAEWSEAGANDFTEQDYFGREIGTQ
jgi:hypothetical protein